jgi:hypothetical protein
MSRNLLWWENPRDYRQELLKTFRRTRPDLSKDQQGRLATAQLAFAADDLLRTMGRYIRNDADRQALNAAREAVLKLAKLLRGDADA